MDTAQGPSGAKAGLSLAVVVAGFLVAGIPGAVVAVGVSLWWQSRQGEDPYA